jgi:hypothetical protein
MRTLVLIVSVAMVLVSGCGDKLPSPASDNIAKAPMLFYVVSAESIEGGRFIDTYGFRKLGYIAATPNMVITNLEAVHRDLTHHQFDVFIDQNGKRTPVTDDMREKLKISLPLVFRMFPDDAKQFTRLTEKAVGKKILLMINNTPVFAPMVPFPITNQDVCISVDGLDMTKVKQIEARLKVLVK